MNLSPITQKGDRRRILVPRFASRIFAYLKLLGWRTSFAIRLRTCTIKLRPCLVDRSTNSSEAKTLPRETFFAPSGLKLEKGSPSKVGGDSFPGRGFPILSSPGFYEWPKGQITTVGGELGTQVEHFHRLFEIPILDSRLAFSKSSLQRKSQPLGGRILLIIQPLPAVFSRKDLEVHARWEISASLFRSTTVQHQGRPYNLSLLR